MTHTHHNTIPLWLSVQLSILAYVIVTWYIYYYRGYLPKINEKTVTYDYNKYERKPYHNELESVYYYHEEENYHEPRSLHYSAPQRYPPVSSSPPPHHQVTRQQQQQRPNNNNPHFMLQQQPVGGNIHQKHPLVRDYFL